MLRYCPEEIFQALLEGDRAILAQAITLIESQHPKHRDVANRLIGKCLKHSGKETLRIGISGTPGVGKSTFIEAFGIKLCSAGHRVAVLSVDPSSTISGGSILGDKTRMPELATHPDAYIRPSPSRGHLGGVTGQGWETVLLCETAGFDRVIIETVGVGQSEVGVRSIADFFVLLQTTGGGDEIQYLKKGIIEMVDAILITKADGENVVAAKIVAEEFRQTLRMLKPYNEHWKPHVLECSARTGKGLDEAKELIDLFRNEMEKVDYLATFRKRQQLQWFHASVREGVIDHVFGKKSVTEQLRQLECDIVEERVTALEASMRFLKIFSN